MKTILVAGGAGFLGSHLCRKLLNEGNKVVALDNFYTGCIDNVSDLLSNFNFSLVAHDVRINYNFVGHIDEIYNLACPASPVHYQADPIYTSLTSVIGSQMLLNLAKSYNAKILLTSTSEIYGDPLKHPQDESYFGNVNPIGIRSCYDEGKRMAETLFSDYHRHLGVNVKIARLFNTYGENMAVNDGRVVSNFINQAINERDITIYGDGLQTRSFCYVSDTVDGLIKPMNSEYSFSYLGAVNIGNDQEFNIAWLANKVINLCGRKSKVVYKDRPQDDPAQRKPDLRKSRYYLGYQPTIDIEDGLQMTIKYFLELKKKQ